VLIIFSVFLTQQSGKEMPKTPVRRKIASLLAVLCGFALTALIVYRYNFQPTSKPFAWSVNRIGTEMLNTGTGGFALPFEVVSMLLLAALVGCIVIAMRTPAQPAKKGVEIEHSKLSSFSSSTIEKEKPVITEEGGVL